MKLGLELEATPTRDLQAVHADLALQVETTPPLGVIGSTEAGHIHHALLVDVHVTGWRERGRRCERKNSAATIPHVCFLNEATSF